MPHLGIRVTADTLRRLDELRGKRTRSACVRRLIEAAEPSESPTGPAGHEEALELLSASARTGSVTAQRELVRYWADREPKAPDEDIAAIVEQLEQRTRAANGGRR